MPAWTTPLLCVLASSPGSRAGVRSTHVVRPRAATAHAAASPTTPAAHDGERRSSGRSSHVRAETDPPGHGQRLRDHVQRHFRVDVPELDEDDGDLADTGAVAQGFVEGLDEKRLPVGDLAVERDAAERLPPPAGYFGEVEQRLN